MSLLRFDFEGDTKIFENPLYELVAYDLAEVLPIMRKLPKTPKNQENTSLVLSVMRPLLLFEVI